MTDLEHLRRIVGDIVPIEYERGGLLCFAMRDGSRLSFGTGTGGRLNMIVIQYAPDVPPIVAERQAEAHPDDCGACETCDRLFR